MELITDLAELLQYVRYVVSYLEMI